MKSKLISLFAAGIVLSWCFGISLVAAAGQDLVAAVKKATDELSAADRVLAAAQTGLQRARDNLDINRFNSPAYNVRITAQQLQAAKEKLDKADPKEKADAQELYELAQELAEQRKTELQAAEKALPEKEAEAKAADEKYSATRAVADKLAAEFKSLLRQTESDAQVALRESKLATEKAAFSKAAAEQKAAANAQLSKTMGELVAAGEALQKVGAVLKGVSEGAQPAKDQAEKATRAYADALQAAAQHLSALQPDQCDTAASKVTARLLEADRAVQKSSAGLQQAKQELQNKTNAVKESENRVKAAQEAVEKRIAKTRARKDLEREQEAVKRVEAAKRDAEQALSLKTADAEKAQRGYAAALQTAVQTLVMSPDAETCLGAETTVIAKAIADKDAEMRKENAALARLAADAQAAADKAQVALTASDKLVAERVAVREALNRIGRQRFFRDASLAQNELRQLEAAMTSANQELQSKTAALNRASADAAQAKDRAAKAQKGAAVQAASVASAAQEKKAAEKSAQEKEAGAKLAAQKAKEALEAAAVAQAGFEKSRTRLKTAEQSDRETAQAAKDAEQKAAVAEATFVKATAEKNAADQAANQRRQAFEAAPVKVAIAKAAAYGGLKPLATSAWDYAKARHLLVRAGFGGTPEEVAKLHGMGLYRAVDQLVNYTNQPSADIAFSAQMKEWPEPYESSLSGEEQRLIRLRRVAKDRQQIQNMRTWWLQRMIESPRPLEEKLTLFWHGQIPAQYSDVGDSYYMYLQNQLFRDNAAGSFAALLHGISHDAAMLKYLNNDTNVKGRANENLAREIMELFSMGRDQGYSELDIRQGARALTGYTYDVATGQFRFISDRHDPDSKTIFAKQGAYSGDDFVQLILDTPYPPRFLARQLFAFFAHDDPSYDTVEALATVLRLNNYELRPMLENLFLSEEFYGERAMGAQIKAPVQLVVELHRELGLKNPDLAYLASAVRDMGQDLFEPPSVFGWQGGRTWISTSRAFGRYNALAEILERRPRGGKAGVDVVGAVLAGHKFQSHTEVVDHFVKCCLSVPLSEEKRQALVEFLAPLPPPAEWNANANTVNARLTRLLVMLICSPEYQLG